MHMEFNMMGDTYHVVCNSLDNSPSSDPSSHSASQEFSTFYETWNFITVYKDLLLVTTLGQMNQVHNLFL
jgi:hypothetical protein